MARFTAAGVMVLLVVAAVSVRVSRQAGTTEAIDDARRTTEVGTRAVVEPNLPHNPIDATAMEFSVLDDAVRRHLLSESLVRIKLWDAEGRILYSDEPRLIGNTYPLHADELRALRLERTDAEITDLSGPENRFERGFGKLLEIYVPTRAASGDVVLFEAYFRYDAVSDAAGRIWLAFAPVFLGGLVVLELIRWPMAWRMTRRVRERDEQRERLLLQAVDASNAERRRIASDLHDGVVQDLVGTSFALAAAADRVAAGHAEHAATALTDAAAATRQNIRALRSLLVEIYPPNLETAGLESALLDLTAPLASRGIDVVVDLAPDLPHDTRLDALVFRAAQEALRNVVSHAGATTVHLTLAATDHAVALTVDDDGRGLPAAASDTSVPGHLGLRILGDLAREAGGALELGTSPLGGARVRLKVPVP